MIHGSALIKKVSRGEWNWPGFRDHDGTVGPSNRDSVIMPAPKPRRPAGVP
jgi:hypothetical protein